MIIETILEVVYNLIDHLMVLNIPVLPDDIYIYLDQAFDYISFGASIVNVFAPLPYLMSLFGVLVAVDIGIAIYHLVLWVLKKIPMLGIE